MRFAGLPLLLCFAFLASARAEFTTKGAAPSAAPLKTPAAVERKARPRARPKPKPPEAPKLKPAAVLLSGANVDFAAQMEWYGGKENYWHEVRGLADLLSKRGVAAEIITDEDIKKDKLWGYQSLYVIDTFAMDKATVDQIRNFVAGGGVLVAVGEIGRYQNAGWTVGWPFAEVFGLKMIATDEYGTGVSQSDSLYRQAEAAGEAGKEPLLSGLGPAIDFGPLARGVWATEAAGAKVLAVYPKHVRVVKEADGQKRSQTVEQPISAISLNRAGKGAAIYISVLAGGRKPGGLEPSGDLPALLKNAQSYAAPSLTKISTPPPEPVVACSQLGYLPGQKKRVVLSADKSAAISDAKFAVYELGREKPVAAGNLSPVEKPFWGQREWMGDFSQLTKEGSYSMEVSWRQGKQAKKIRTASFSIEPDLYKLRLIPTQLSFFHEMRCGDRCHFDSPVRGGYHDATGDWSSRMWSMPAVVYGLARYLEADNGASDAAREELARAISWCLRMQGENGEVWEGVVPPNEQSDIHVRPWAETAPRTLQKKDNAGFRIYFIAAMARAARALKTTQGELSKKAADAAKKSWDYTLLKWTPMPDTADLGNWIWATVELYWATQDPKYLEEAKNRATEQLQRQHRRNDEVADAVVCGDFFDSPDRDKFGRHQYKTFHTLGIYAGLIELHRALPPSDPLWWPLHAALERLLHGYFEAMASVTPYGLVGKALEREKKSDKFRIYFFDNARAWEGAHFGYNSDYLAEGLLALDYGRQTGQESALELADNQVQWMLGNNPLGYSMVDGVGSRIAPMIDASLGTGRLLGGIPNGYEGEGARNAPVWGESWNSREYWLPHNAFFLPLIAELADRDMKRERQMQVGDIPFTWRVEKADQGYTVTVPREQIDEHHLELLVEGGKSAPLESGGWAVEPAGNEPIILLLRDARRPEIYLQKFILKP